MSYSPTLGSVFNRTKMRDPSHVCSFSGMCAMCTADCIGSCEIGLSAVRGMETVYPTTTGENQIASEKVYPVDYSHFNINGRSFGAMGAPLDADRATIYHVGLEREIGTLNPVKLALPIILPALIKLNWPDYFGGAAMAGVNAVIGEGAVSKDPTLAYENGKVVHAPKLREMLDAFNKYDRGYGQIILQANYDDDAQGVPEYAIRECGAKAIEFKFGQSAKGTQPANLVPTLEEALKKCEQGFLVLPDPRDPGVQEAYGRKACPAFHVYGRLPIWSDDYLIGRIAQLRDMGMANGEKSEAEDKKRLPESRKVVELKDAVEEVESCSACYGYLIPALAMLKDEGLFGKLHEKISIGQGYRGKEGTLGVGNCTRKFAHSCPGCPPTEQEIYEFLKAYLNGKSS